MEMKFLIFMNLIIPTLKQTPEKNNNNNNLNKKKRNKIS